MSAGAERHADELLSARLDGELDAATDAWVSDHLSSCAECRAAEVELEEARTMVRSLPVVDGTPVVAGFLARHRRLIRLGAGFVGLAAIVLGLLALNAAVHRPLVLPDIDHLAAVHETTAHERMEGMRPVADVASAYAAPPGLMGSAASLSRQAVYDGRDLTVVVYRDGDVLVSVYEQPGYLDWDHLPMGETEQVNEHRVWIGATDPTVVVTEIGHLVVTVVSEDRAAALTAVAGLPERWRTSTWDRLHDACQRFTAVFALGG